MATKFANGKNPFTGELDVQVTAIPKHADTLRGVTKFDEYFDQIANCDKAVEVPGDLFQAVRKASVRYLEYRGLRATHRARQRKQPSGRYAIWFVKEAPRKNQKRAGQ